MMDEARGVIGIPAQDMSYTAFWKSYVGLEKPNGSVLICTENVLTAVARNQIVKGMLKYPRAEWLFFMDSDMLFPARALRHLLKRFERDHKPHVDIVGGAYFQRFEPHELIAYQHVGGELPYRPLTPEWIEYVRSHRDSLPLDGRFTGRIIGSDGLMEVDGIGTGCLLIRRKVFEAMAEPWFSYRDEGSEDLYFCREAKRAGFKIHLDRGLVCGHVNRIVVGPVHCLSANGELVNASD
jgi:GT2 family glycosyltransferase